MKLNPKIVVILAALFCAFSAIFVRYSTAPSVTMAAYRMGLASLILLPAILKGHINELKNIDKKTLLLCLVNGVFLGLHFAAYFESLKHTSVASAVVLVDTQVIFVALIMWLVMKQKIPFKGIIGIVLTLGGSVIIALADKSGGGSNVLYGDLLALAGSVLFAFYASIGYVARKNLSTTAYTFILYFVAFITLTLISFVTGDGMTGYGFMNVFWALMLATFPTMLGHSLYSWSLKYVSPVFMSTAVLLEPVFSTIMAVFLFKEIPVMLQVAGIIIIIIGVVTYSLAKDGTSE